MRMILFIILCFTLSSHADITVRIGLDGVVLVAKQRGDLFHMASNYIQLQTKQSYHYPDENLKKSMQEYEEVMQGLSEITEDTVIQDRLQHSQEAWKHVKPIFLSALNKQAPKKMEKEKLGKILEGILTLSADMKVIQDRLMTQSLDQKVRMELNATSNILEASAQMSTYYLIEVSILSELIDAQPWEKSAAAYEKALTLLEGSIFNQGKIFKKHFKGIRKVHLFNTMTKRFSKTPIPSLMIKKNNKAYLEALISMKLIAAASTEGAEKTIDMFQ